MHTYTHIFKSSTSNAYSEGTFSHFGTALTFLCILVFTKDAISAAVSAWLGKTGL